MSRARSFDAQAVLGVAERQFAKAGYAGTSIDDIVAATGLGRSSLYAAFGDKHDLFVGGLEAYCDRREAEIAAALEGPDARAFARLEAYLLGAARAVERHEDRVGCMAARFAVELGGHDDAAAERIQQDFTTIQAALRACIEAAQRHGDLDPAASAPVVARHLFAVARGFEVLASGGERRKDLEVSARSVLAGLRTP
jgi:AcrR family transcriptional regulator